MPPHKKAKGIEIKGYKYIQVLGYQISQTGVKRKGKRNTLALHEVNSDNDSIYATHLTTS